MERSRILVVDDDPLIRGSLYEMLRGQDFDVETAADGSQAIHHLGEGKFHLVLADWKMPEMDGISLLNHIKSKYPDVNVVLITGFGNLNSAVDAFRQGAFDYLTKPIQPDELEVIIQRALAPVGTPNETTEDSFSDVVGNHSSMKRLFGTILQVAQSPVTVLLEGESGTGKRLIAHAIHRADPRRRNAPFVEVSCGALPETLLESELFGHVRGAFTGAIRDKQGRFELADGGTLFLDEIDAFSPALQVKLLRALQERTFERVGDSHPVQVDVRIIVATNRSLEKLVKEGQFREDLYYRVNVVSLRLPTLRERASDIPILTEHFFRRSCAKLGKVVHGIDPEVMKALTAHDWPGNVRELENAMERAVVLSRQSTIVLEDLPETVLNGTLKPFGPSLSKASEPLPREPLSDSSSDSKSTRLKDALLDPERDIIIRVLKECAYNRSEAAKRLGIHRATLYHKLRKLSLDPNHLPVDPTDSSR